MRPEPFAPASHEVMAQVGRQRRGAVAAAGTADRSVATGGGRAAELSAGGGMRASATCCRQSAQNRSFDEPNAAASRLALRARNALFLAHQRPPRGAFAWVRLIAPFLRDDQLLQGARKFSSFCSDSVGFLAYSSVRRQPSGRGIRRLSWLIHFWARSGPLPAISLPSGGRCVRGNFCPSPRTMPCSR